MTAGTVTDAHEKPLAESLSRFRERAFLFVEPGGNWGDGLIYLGAQTLARRLGLRWRAAQLRGVHCSGSRTTALLCTCTAVAGLTTSVAARHRPHSCMRSATIPDLSSSVRRRWTTLKDSSRLNFCRGCTGGWPPTSLFSCANAPASRRLQGACRAEIDLHLDHDTALQLTPEDALHGRAQVARYALLALREDNEAPDGSEP